MENMKDEITIKVGDLAKAFLDRSKEDEKYKELSPITYLLFLCIIADIETVLFKDDSETPYEYHPSFEGN